MAIKIDFIGPDQPRTRFLQTRVLAVLPSWCLLFLVGMAVLWSPTPTRADEIEDALKLSAEAVRLYQEGRYEEAETPSKEALELFQKKLEPDDPMIASALSNLATVYDALGKYDQAGPLYRKTLKIKEGRYGPDHPETAAALNNLAAHEYYLGRYDQAEPLYRRALKIRETILGPDHPDTAVSLNNLAALLDDRARYQEARPLYERSLVIREKVFGPEDPRVAVALGNLAGALDALGEYQEAEKLYLRALAIQEKQLGPAHPGLAVTLNNLALLYDTLGRFEKAGAMYEKALSIRETILGPDHPDTAVSLNNLAAWHEALGEFDKARALYRQALNIREKALGTDHPDTAQSFNNLGALFDTLGRFDQAEPLYLKALNIWEKALGPDHIQVGRATNNLAEFYKNLGDCERAAPYYRRSLEIRTKVFGADHPETALALNNLAGFLESQGKLDEAEKKFKQALDIWRKALGPDHLRTATAEGNLAEILLRAGKVDEAEALYQNALKVRAQTLGPDHPDTAAALNNLAGVDLVRGNLVQCLARQEKALTILKKSLGTEHPLVSACLNNLAVVTARADMIPRALEYFDQASRVDQTLIDQVMSFTSEDRKLKFLAQKRLSLYAYLGLVAPPRAPDPGFVRAAFDAWLNRKGRILEAQRKFQEALYYSDDPETALLLIELARIRTRISQLVFSPSEEEPSARMARLDNLKQQKESLENRLARRGGRLAQKIGLGRVDSRKLALSLPEGSVLIDFARIQDFDFHFDQGATRWLKDRYLAFVLHSGPEGSLHLVDLGPARAVDRAVADFKKEVMDLEHLPNPQVESKARRLYDLVFSPLHKALGPAREIFISPDGNLNLIPFEVLIGPDGHPLIQDFTFNYLAAGRDLLRFGDQPSLSGKVVLMGDPDFDLPQDRRKAALRKLNLRTESKTTTRAAQAEPSASFRNLAFDQLPGTRAEILAVARQFPQDQVQVFLGDDALEEVLAQLHSPGLIHLATHGFFLPDGILPSESTGPLAAADADASPCKPARDWTEADPLVRSGLALAGANRTLAGSPSPEGRGLLTAEKVLNLNLDQTRLVVLSACETGLGEVQNGEGVYGLRRALAQAGAQSQVMSMWAVPDRETQELMVQFYQGLQKGLTAPQALREAALKEREIAQKRYGQAHPLFWGAFVFLGNP